MDLKIKDVAELLNVSETTIRRWLLDGKIPAYSLNHQYRFSRVEIEDWVLSQKLGDASALPAAQQPDTDCATEEQKSSPKSLQGNKQFSLYRALHKGGILHQVKGSSKTEVIRTAVKAISADLDLDPEAISDLLLEREALQSTGLNHGIAIPHTRDFLLNAHFDLVTLVFPEKPIPYDALDGQPVHALFFLFASNDKHHLHLLAKIAHLSSLPETQRLLAAKPSKDAFLKYVKDWESGLHNPLTTT
jgi:nitrogen PTS system EIIA component